MITLENKNLLLELSEENGSVVSLHSKLTGWEIAGSNGASDAFRMMIPLEHHYDTGSEFDSKRNNTVRSSTCKMSRYSFDDTHAEFVWDSLVSEFGGEHAIHVKASVVLTEENATFFMEIQNDSPHVVESVYYPYLCPFQMPDKTEPFEFMTEGYASAHTIPMYPRFQNCIGYYGVDTPTLYAGSNPQMPFAFLKNPTQGLAVMIGERSMQPLFYLSRLYPGWGESIDASWPEADTIGGKEVYCDFTTGQLPYVAPGECFRLTPVLLQPYCGDWSVGADIYRRKRAEYFSTARVPAWLSEPHAWLQYHINSPEDELRLRFPDLPALAEECKEAGIRAIQLVGWNDGGQDQGNPSHAPDPRLGTPEELATAIKKCGELGVKIILFSKFNWVDRATRAYHEGLRRITIKDPFGDDYYHPGYQYQTLAQMAGVRVKRFSPICFQSDEAVDVCKAEFDKMLAAGAAGTLYDECFHRGGAWLCFDPEHGHRVPAPAQEKDFEFAKAMREGAPEDFLLAGEALYDSMFECYHLSYFRSEDKDHIPLERYVANDCKIMTAVTGFHDRDMLNQCLAYNYIVSYEPYNFKGFPSDMPLTIDYGKQMHAIREELAEYLWDGEFCYTHGVLAADDDGEPYPLYSVFRSRKTGKAAAVLVNYETNQAVSVRVTPQADDFTRWRLVDGTWQTFEGCVTLPPNSAAVVL